jgi:peptidoglycan/xylan/chitin deacetylase (PgdA/CDA1 family)
MKTSTRNFIGNFVAKTLISFGFVKRAIRKVKNGEFILSICFHAPSKHLFESSINWLTQNGFYFISVDEVEKAAAGKIPFPKGAVVLTIDDGWQSNLDNIVPVAEKNKIPVTIFVSTEAVEKGNGYWWSYINEARKIGLAKDSVEFFKSLDNEDRIKIIEETKTKININRQALTIDQIKDISKNKYVSLGSHSVSHPILPRCSNIESNFEITQSKKLIEGWVNKEIKHFAYPNGDFSNREISILKRTGYTLAFGTDQKYLTKENIIKVYKLPRRLMVENASFEENICRMIGVWPVKPKRNRIFFP